MASKAYKIRMCKIDKAHKPWPQSFEVDKKIKRGKMRAGEVFRRAVPEGNFRWTAA